MKRIIIVAVIIIFTLGLVCFVLSAVNGGNISSKIDSNGCFLPKYPENGQWTIHGNSSHASDKKVESGDGIVVTCNSQYMLNGSSTLSCDNGKWNEKIGQCLELCPPIREKHSTRVTCATFNGKNINCSTPTNGTIATITCAPFYENEELNRNPFRICINGKWNEEFLSCSAVCGLEPILSRNGSLEHRYPWDVLIYVKVNNYSIRTSHGTLINEKTIITAAKTVVNELNFPDFYPFSADIIFVAAGRTLEYFPGPEPAHTVQYSSVQEVFLLKSFKGSVNKYLSDIAVVIVSSPFKMTSHVQPACVDWSNKYKKEFSLPGILAKTMAPDNGIQTTTFFETIVPLLSEKECFELLHLTAYVHVDTILSYHFLLSIVDKFCARGIIPIKTANCSNDVTPGAGLITKNPFNEKYYVIGIVSMGSLPKDACSKNKFTLFTRISSYIDFISEKSKIYSSIEPDQFQTSCGFKSVQPQPLIVNGSIVAKGDYPWQVAIYKIRNSQKIMICGGSLINSRLILTAAHCVTNQQGETLPKENYIIAVGKYYRDFDDSRDSNYQFSGLKEIIVPSTYKGWSQNFLSDIAILVSKTSFKLSREIHPICVDWEATYEGQFLKPNITGFIAGWGFTQENQSSSENLRELEVPYIDTKQCRNELPTDFEIFLTHDKFCSGFLNKGKSACSGDSGGGLVFKNKFDDRYYLAGVISVSPQSKYGCNSQHYTLYTRVSEYIDNFIRETASLYWG